MKLHRKTQLSIFTRISPEMHVTNNGNGVSFTGLKTSNVLSYGVFYGVFF